MPGSIGNGTWRLDPSVWAREGTMKSSISPNTNVMTNLAFDAAPFRLSLIGGFRLWCGGRSLILPLSAERLLAFLGLQDRAVHRSYVAGILWPESTEERAAANLRSALWRLRLSRNALVDPTRSHLSLNPGVAIDLRVIADYARMMLRDHRACDRNDIDVAQLSRDLLPDWYEDWVVVERERFRQLRLHALETLCARLTAAGRFGEAIESGLAAVAGEPLRESANRVLIQAYLAEGNRAEATRQWVGYKRLLLDELGLEVQDSPFTLGASSVAPVHGERSRASLS
jgi:DNA-binding SARP family transcriptional activator